MLPSQALFHGVKHTAFDCCQARKKKLYAHFFPPSGKTIIAFANEPFFLLLPKPNNWFFFSWTFNFSFMASSQSEPAPARVCFPNKCKFASKLNGFARYWRRAIFTWWPGSSKLWARLLVLDVGVVVASVGKGNFVLVMMALLFFCSLSEPRWKGKLMWQQWYKLDAKVWREWKRFEVSQFITTLIANIGLYKHCQKLAAALLRKQQIF